MSKTSPPLPPHHRSWLQRLFPPAPPPLEGPPSEAFGLIGSYYDNLMQHVPYREWVDYVEAILARFRLRPGRVLDLACGTGKVGGEMAKRGYRAVGVDLSEGMVRVAKAEQRLPAAVQDARALGLRAEVFDLVVCLYDSLNYILQPAELLRAFEGLGHCLAPGGLLIFDVNTIRALALDLFTQDNLRSQEPLLYSWKSHWDPTARLCTVDMWFCWRGEGEPQEFWEVHRQRGHTDEELRELLAAAGLVLRATYDAYTFDAPHVRSTRVFYVAEKPRPDHSAPSGGYHA